MYSGYSVPSWLPGAHLVMLMASGSWPGPVPSQSLPCAVPRSPGKLQLPSGRSPLSRGKHEASFKHSAGVKYLGKKHLSYRLSHFPMPFWSSLTSPGTFSGLWYTHLLPLHIAPMFLMGLPWLTTNDSGVPSVVTFLYFSWLQLLLLLVLKRKENSQNQQFSLSLKNV